MGESKESRGYGESKKAISQKKVKASKKKWNCSYKRGTWLSGMLKNLPKRQGNPYIEEASSRSDHEKM